MDVLECHQLTPPNKMVELKTLDQITMGKKGTVDWQLVAMFGGLVP